MAVGSHYIEFYSNPGKVPATMPDGGASTFLGHLVLNEAHPQWDASWATFINGLTVTDGIPQDLLVTREGEGSEPTVAHGTQRVVQGAHPELVLGLGLPSLHADGYDFYRLWREVPDGPFENKAGCVPTADGYAGYHPLNVDGATIEDWTAGNWDATNTGCIVAGQGPFGKSLYFNGIVYASMGSVIADPSVLTFSVWMKVEGEAWGGNQTMIAAVGDELMLLRQLGTCLEMNTFTSYGGNIYWPYGDSRNWQRVTWVHKASETEKLYVNGIQHEATYQPSPPSFATVSLGRAWSGVPNYRGWLAEFVASSVARSGNWEVASHNDTSNNATFWTVGPEVSTGGLLVPRHYNVGFNAGYNRGVN